MGRLSRGAKGGWIVDAPLVSIGPLVNERPGSPPMRRNKGGWGARSRSAGGEGAGQEGGTGPGPGSSSGGCGRWIRVRSVMEGRAVIVVFIVWLLRGSPEGFTGARRG